MSLLDTYRISFSNFLEEVEKLKGKIFETFFSTLRGFHLQKGLEINSAIIRNPLITKLEEFSADNQLDELKSQDLSFLKHILNSPVRIEKLFRASEHSFSATAFH